MKDMKLNIEDIKEGSGDEVKSGDYITVHYTGTLENGEVFDSSKNHGKPFSFRIGIGAVIDGWEMGIMGMKVGGKRKLTIPPQLAYGDRSVGSIPANSTLVFDVEIVSID